MYTKQKNLDADRRRYAVNQMVVFTSKPDEASIGKVIQVDEDMLEVEEYRKAYQKYSSTGKKFHVQISRCLPGGFELTNSGAIPVSIKRQLQAKKMQLT